MAGGWGDANLFHLSSGPSFLHPLLGALDRAGGWVGRVSRAEHTHQGRSDEAEGKQGVVFVSGMDGWG